VIIKIGRDPKNDYAIDNKSVSRQHATLEITEGRIVLSDSSKSGTYLARSGRLERITYMEVAERDVVLFGSERVVVRDIIRAVTEKNRAVVYERNPLTGEVVKK
jgi:pSer/pThr/pTyr-binding forkhead associated (FHA) protein